MKNKIVLLSLFAYLSASTCFGEFLKVPILFKHFIEHKSLNQEISFTKFLYQHYQDDDGDDNDNDRDKQLPFKSIEPFNVAVNTGLIYNSSIKFKLAPLVSKADLQFANYQDLKIPSPFLSTIWQPPKYS